MTLNKWLMYNTFVTKKKRKKVTLKLNSGGIGKKYKYKTMISIKITLNKMRNNCLRMFKI